MNIVEKRAGWFKVRENNGAVTIRTHTDGVLPSLQSLIDIHGVTTNFSQVPDEVVTPVIPVASNSNSSAESAGVYVTPNGWGARWSYEKGRAQTIGGEWNFEEITVNTGIHVGPHNVAGGDVDGMVTVNGQFAVNGAPIVLKDVTGNGNHISLLNINGTLQINGAPVTTG